MFVLHFTTFFHSKSFLKKNKQPKIVLITSFTILHILLPSTHLSRITFYQLSFIFYFIFYLHAPIFNCVNLLWSSVRISSFCKNLFLCGNLFKSFASLLIYDYLWESLLIYDHLWESFRTSFFFLRSLWK